MAILSFVRILTPFLLLLALLPAALTAYKDGPPANSAGGFGESTCHQCHFDNPLNAPGGTFDLAGVPPRYEPSASYRITVSLSRGDMQRGGFQLAARFASGGEKGRQAGRWQLADDRAQVIAGEHDSTMLFVEHTARGSVAAPPGALSWTIGWTAPPGGGPVEFSAAGNASNDDASALGDYVYVTAIQSTP
jgi:hypothetical protein